MTRHKYRVHAFLYNFILTPLKKSKPSQETLKLHKRNSEVLMHSEGLIISLYKEWQLLIIFTVIRLSNEKKCY